MQIVSKRPERDDQGDDGVCIRRRYALCTEEVRNTRVCVRVRAYYIALNNNNTNNACMYVYTTAIIWKPVIRVLTMSCVCVYHRGIINGQQCFTN